MSTPPNVVWRHYGATGNAHGIGMVSADVPFGRHAISGGGYAGSYPLVNNQNGDDAQGVTPMVGSFLDYDESTDTTYFIALFAVPEGTNVPVHVWALLAEPS